MLASLQEISLFDFLADTARGLYAFVCEAGAIACQSKVRIGAHSAHNRGCHLRKFIVFHQILSPTSMPCAARTCEAGCTPMCGRRLYGPFAYVIGHG